MKMRRTGSKSKVRFLRIRVLGICLLTGLFVIAIAMRPEARTTFAQSTEPRAVPPTAPSDAAARADAQAPSQDLAAKAQVTDASTDPPKKQIALDSANLLKMANDLKASMDKFTPDTLSLGIIRQAEGIEKTRTQDEVEMKSMQKNLTVDVLCPVLLLALFFVVSCALAGAQSDQETGTGQLSSHPLQGANGRIDPTATMDDDDPATRQRQMIMFYAALNRSMVSDTNKLLKLVTELNAELSSTNPDALTPAQLKKVAAIEKFAHNVKDAMKTSAQGSSSTLKDALKEPPRHVKPSL